MRTFYTLLLTLALAGCAALKPAPEKQLARLVAKHPDLVQPETVQVKVPVTVPEVRFEKTFQIVHDTVWLQRETTQLDSLINNLAASLDSTQKAAVKASVRPFLLSRPVWRDTLCFDTLGVKGRFFWLKGRQYKIEILRAAIQDSTAATAVVGKLRACPPAPHFPWYDPRGWPWWWVLLAGFLAGASITLRATR